MQKLFKTAVEKSASDIHLITDLPPYLRIQGELVPMENESELSASTIESLINGILTDEQQQRLQQDKGLDFSYELDDGTRLRVNIHYERGNLGLVARIISSQIPTMKQLHMPEVVYDLTRSKQGLIIITGPTGSGKSTTMAAMIDLINQERKAHIVTLEDPIEYIHQPKESIIIQRELGEDMISFEAGLRHALRQDPNVIMVGEMRDLDTIASTLTLAETGHLVLATLHTHDAAQTVDRIVDVFPPHQQNQIRLQLSFTLKGVVSQHLVPTTRGDRMAVREVMVSTPAISNIIRENKISQIKTAIQTSGNRGMFTMEQDLQRLLNDKHITKETAELYQQYVPTID